MATDLQAQMVDAFKRANEAVSGMSDEASNALHDAVYKALDDAAVLISEKSGELETATAEVREQIRVASEEALIKAAQNIADGSATIEQAAQQLQNAIADKTQQIK